MIIWNGFGILIPIIAIGGFIAGFAISTAMGQPAFGGGIGLLLAAFMNWALWKMVYPKQPKIQLNAVTGQQYLVKPNHSLFFIPARAWTWILVILAVPATLLGITGEKAAASEAQKPGFKEFTAANELIGTSSKGIVHGNTDAAKKAANSFSKSMKLMTEAFFTGGSKANLMTGGDFLTYCHESKDTVVFLCHVPSLRSYKTDETKSALQEIAWASAQKTVEELYPDRKMKVVIGLRGTSTYGSMQQGEVGDESVLAVSTPEKSAFFPFFVASTEPDGARTAVPSE